MPPVEGRSHLVDGVDHDETRRGSIAAELSGPAMTQENVILAASGMYQQ